MSIEFSQPIKLFIRGDASVSEESVDRALEQSGDRKAVIAWAQAHPNIVQHSARLQKVYHMALDWNCREDVGGPVAEQVIASHHIYASVRGFIKNTFSTSFNLDDFAARIRSEIPADWNVAEFEHLEEAITGGLISENEAASYIRNILTISDLDENNIGKFIDLLDKLPEKVSGHILFKFSQTLNELSEAIPKERREVFLENATFRSLERRYNEEKEALLENCSSQTLSKIESCKNHAIMGSVCKSILEGKWIELVKRHQYNPDLSYVFLEAFIQKKISSEDLAMAMSVHRGYVNCSTFKVISFEEASQLIKQENTNSSGLADAKEIMTNYRETIPKNHRCFLIVDRSAIDDYTNNVIDTTFKPGSEPYGYVKLNKQHMVVSFGLAKALLQEHNITMIPILGVSKRGPMRERTRERLSDFALLFPKEPSLLHGSEDKIILGYLHDPFHAKFRGMYESEELWNQLMDFSTSIEKENVTWDACSNKLEYKGSPEPKFIKKPTLDDAHSYWLEGMAGSLIDAVMVVQSPPGYFFKEDIAEKAVDNFMMRYKNQVKDRQEMFDEIILSKEVEQKVRTKLIDLFVDTIRTGNRFREV